MVFSYIIILLQWTFLTIWVLFSLICYGIQVKILVFDNYQRCPVPLNRVCGCTNNVMLLGKWKDSHTWYLSQSCATKSVLLSIFFLQLRWPVEYNLFIDLLFYAYYFGTHKVRILVFDNYQTCPGGFHKELRLVLSPVTS